MHRRKLILLVGIVLIAGLLAGCGAAAPPATEAPFMAAPAATMGPAVVRQPAAEDAAKAAAGVAPAAAPTAAAVYQTGPDTTVSQNIGFADHMIVKNGDVKLLVKDTDQAMDGVMQIVGDVHGYVISSRVWYQNYYEVNYKYVTLTMGVPVDQFENALRRLRDLSVRVLDENASGEDVTDQYVDLQSQLTNLEATRDRIKTFLDQARDVDEALRVNQQLSDVEVQIEKIKGQMNYLSSRSAFSTITINLEPELPKITATPTPSPTPVAVEPLGPWDPGQTTQQATNALVSVYRVIVDMLIWAFVVLFPIAAPIALLGWLVAWLTRKRTKTEVKA